MEIDIISSINISKNRKMIIYGKHPVLTILRNKKRKIIRIYVTEKKYIELIRVVKKENINIDHKIIIVVSKRVIDKLVPDTTNHQDILVKTEEVKYIDDTSFIKLCVNSKNSPPLLILDQLTDCNNIGSIIRSAIAFKVYNIALTKYNFPSIDNAIIAKSSAGMSELARFIMVKNINHFLKELKKVNYWCIGLDMHGTEVVQNIKNYKNIALIIGSESNGIRTLIKKNCDLLAKIPTSSEVESLNAANAASIALYQLFSNEV